MTVKNDTAGYLVQSAGKGEYMVLRTVGGSWLIVSVGHQSYFAACDAADALAAS
jgi:hypothetical protein